MIIKILIWNYKKFNQILFKRELFNHYQVKLIEERVLIIEIREYQILTLPCLLKSKEQEKVIIPVVYKESTKTNNQ